MQIYDEVISFLLSLVEPFPPLLNLSNNSYHNTKLKLQLLGANNG